MGIRIMCSGPTVQERLIARRDAVEVACQGEALSRILDDDAYRKCGDRYDDIIEEHLLCWLGRPEPECGPVAEALWAILSRASLRDKKWNYRTLLHDDGLLNPFNHQEFGEDGLERGFTDMYRRMLHELVSNGRQSIGLMVDDPDMALALMRALEGYCERQSAGL